MPLLTIAIPTYNRSAYLDRLLASLLPQLEGEERVELLISDNASTDETASVLEEYSRRGLRFRSILNATNMGADRNFAQCFAEAAGKYVWLIGDDDVLCPGALSGVLELLARETFDLVQIPGREFREDQAVPQAPASLRIKRIPDARNFVLQVHVNLTFISGMIVNRERVLALPHPPFEELAGTNLLQLSWTYTLLRSFQGGACILDQLIGAGIEDRGGYAIYRVFGVNLKQVTEDWLAIPELVRIVSNASLQWFFPRVVLEWRRKRGPFAGENPEALLAPVFAGDFRYYLYLYPIMKLPPALGRIWMHFCYLLNRLDAKCGYPILGPRLS